MGNYFDNPKQLTWKPQVHLYLWCNKEAGLLYTRGDSSICTCTTYMRRRWRRRILFVLGSISNLYHIETANYNSILCKLFCTCKFCTNYYCTIFTQQEYMWPAEWNLAHPLNIEFNDFIWTVCFPAKLRLLHHHVTGGLHCIILKPGSPTIVTI